MPAIFEVRTPIPIGTTLTPIFTIQGLTPGVYTWEMDVDCAHVGTPTAFTITPGFTGNTSAVNYSLRRFTASAVAASVHTVFAPSASSVWISAVGRGSFVVSTPGDFTISCTRTGGTSSTIQPGSVLELTQIGRP